MSVLADLVGETVIDKDAKTTPVADIVQGIGPDGVVGLYFSAHWCPPCRTFTPELIEFYQKFRETDPGHKMDIIFISSDKDEASFKAYLSEMPWKAMLYNEKDRKVRIISIKINFLPLLEVVLGKWRDQTSMPLYYYGRMQ